LLYSQTFAGALFRQSDIEKVATSEQVLETLYSNYDRTLLTLPVGDSSFRVFGGAPQLTAQDLKILLTNSEVRTFVQGQVVLMENEENYSLYMYGHD
jgi:hypothetical protein